MTVPLTNLGTIPANWMQFSGFFFHQDYQPLTSRGMILQAHRKSDQQNSHKRSKTKVDLIGTATSLMYLDVSRWIHFTLKKFREVDMLAMLPNFWGWSNVPNFGVCQKVCRKNLSQYPENGYVHRENGDFHRENRYFHRENLDFHRENGYFHRENGYFHRENEYFHRENWYFHRENGDETVDSKNMYMFFRLVHLWYSTICCHGKLGTIDVEEWYKMH